MVILYGRHTPENYLADGCIGKTLSPSAAKASYRSYEVDYRRFHQISHAVLRKAFYEQSIVTKTLGKAKLGVLIRSSARSACNITQSRSS